MATETENPEPQETIERELTPDQLLTAIQQLLIATRRHQSRSDRLYANELASRIIAAMPPGYDVRAAELVAKMAEAPEELQRQLAFSSVESARVILTARHTTDAILMEAVSKGFEFRQIVASRTSLSEPVVNRLLFFEEAPIENALLPRAELPLSNSRVRRLINRVEPESSLGYLLSKRQDMAPRLSLRLFWKVEPEGRRAILSRFKVDPAIAANIFTQVLGPKDTKYGNAPLANLARLVSRAHARGDVERMRSGPSPHEKVLGALRTEAGPGAAQRVADEALISLELANKIMEDSGGEAFTVLCAAMNVPEKSFRKLLSERPSHNINLRPFGDATREHLTEIYTKLNASSATAILSYWDIDIQDQHSEEAKAKLEMDIADIKSRLAESYGADDVASEVEKATAAEAQTADRKPAKGLRRLFG